MTKEETPFTERFIKPTRVPKKYDSRDKKTGAVEVGIKPKHRPYHRCPSALHNYLLDDDNE